MAATPRPRSSSPTGSATYTTTMVAAARSRRARYRSGQTTASEFGGVNYTHTRLHGTTRNPWDQERTPGGSSGGTAAAVAGGLVTLGTAGDGGGSIRIPAGFTGMFGLKATYGRIPRGPRDDATSSHRHARLREPVRARHGAVVRRLQRPRPARHPQPAEGRRVGRRVSAPCAMLEGQARVISVDLGGSAVVARGRSVWSPGSGGSDRRRRLGARRREFEFPEASLAWVMSNLVTLMADFSDLYPGCEEAADPEIQFSINISDHTFDLRSAGENEAFRVHLNEAVADVFDQADFVFAATNPDVAFRQRGRCRRQSTAWISCRELGFERALGNNGALTMPSNLAGNPAVSIPAGSMDGLPVGLQVIGRHHSEQLLLELAAIAEAERPWPLVAPGSPF